MTSLRRQMIEDMELRGYSKKIQECYLTAVKVLARHYRRSPDRLTEEEIREFFLYLVNVKHVARSTLAIYLYGIKFFYEKTLKRDWPIIELIRPKKSKKLPVVLILSVNVAVGTMEFVEQTKERLGIRARRGDVIEAGDSFEFREPGAAYASDLAGKSASLRAENTYSWNSHPAISDG